MSSLTAPAAISTPNAEPSPPCSWPFIAGLLIVLSILQAGLLHESFHIKPAADDFPYVDECARGNALGPIAFFRQSFTDQSYRPVASLGIWIALNLGPHHREFALRTLGFVCMAFYTLAAGLWIRATRLSKLGAHVVALVLLFHPVLPAALGSVDGFNAIFSCAALWIGGWGVYRFRYQPIVAAIWVFAFLLIGAGAKEHAFALLFLAPLTALFVADQSRRTRLTITVTLGALAAFGAMLILRKLTIPPGQNGGLVFASMNPIQWAKNAATISAGLLFFGNSAWVYVQQNSIAFLLTGLATSVAVFLIATGLKRAWGENRKSIAFFVLGTIAACFPVGIMRHVSEMYLCPMILPFAFVCAFAFCGDIAEPGAKARGFRPVFRTASTILATTALVFAILTDRSKMHDLRDLGDRAESQLRSALTFLPDDAHDTKLLLVFPDDPPSARRTYSVYLMGDELLLVQPTAPNWLRPGKNITTQTLMVGHHDQDPALFDLVLKWNPQTQRFEKPPTRANS